MKHYSDLDEGTIRRIDWQELLPVTMLFRAFPLTLKLIPLFLLTFAAIWLDYINHVFFLSDSWDNQFSLFYKFYQSFFQPTLLFPVWRGGSDFAMTSSFFSLLCRPTFGLELIFLFFCLIFVRSIAVRLASTQRCGLCESFRFAWHHYPALFTSLVLMLLPLLALSVGLDLLAWTQQIAMLSWATYPLFMFALFLWLFFYYLLILGLPLILAAIAVEASDGFDAVSRAVSYLTQRWLPFFFYSAVAIGLSFLGIKIASFFCSAIQYRPWGFDENSFEAWFFWKHCLNLIPLGYAITCLLTYGTTLYFVLRRSVDGTLFDEFYSRGDAKPLRRLKPILDDAQGAPIVPNSPAPHSEANNSENANSETGTSAPAQQDAVETAKAESDTTGSKKEAF